MADGGISLLGQHSPGVVYPIPGPGQLKRELTLPESGRRGEMPKACRDGLCRAAVEECLHRRGGGLQAAEPRLPAAAEAKQMPGTPAQCARPAGSAAHPLSRGPERRPRSRRDGRAGLRAGGRLGSED